MARAFAAKGRDLALCARRTDRLDELKAQLLERHPRITLAVDPLHVKDHDQVPIRVTVIEPGYIESEMTAKAETTSLMVDNKTGTKAMVDAIERERGRSAVPTWPWAPLVQVLRLLPPKLAARFA